MEEMKAEERRRALAKTLTAEHPVSATALAGQFSVSRQIIVGDIALLRAAGLDIVATPRGYLLGGRGGGVERTVARARLNWKATAAISAAVLRRFPASFRCLPDAAETAAKGERKTMSPRSRLSDIQMPENPRF